MFVSNAVTGTSAWRPPWCDIRCWAICRSGQRCRPGGPVCGARCGAPRCPYGYACTANGFDAQRQRHKWFCGQACQHDKEPLVCLPDVPYPPADCPDAVPDAAPYGKIINVGARFANGSMRLVRDLPIGLPAWKRIYHRARNAVEGRNAAFEAWGLKRIPVYGASRSRAAIFLADVRCNLTTLARLVREATVATGN